MDKSTSVWFFFVLFPIFFAGLWCAICLLLSVIGGWRRLAERFPARSQPSGTRYVMQRARVGLANYKGCLTIYSSHEGLFLSVWPIFRPGHPPLFIPRDEIRNPKTGRFLWHETMTFDVGSPRITTLQLPKKVFEDQNIAS
jgi:hypothetical protein